MRDPSALDQELEASKYLKNYFEFAPKAIQVVSNLTKTYLDLFGMTPYVEDLYMRVDLTEEEAEKLNRGLKERHSYAALTLVLNSTVKKKHLVRHLGCLPLELTSYFYNLVDDPEEYLTNMQKYYSEVYFKSLEGTGITANLLSFNLKEKKDHEVLLEVILPAGLSIKTFEINCEFFQYLQRVPDETTKEGGHVDGTTRLVYRYG